MEKISETAFLLNKDGSVYHLNLHPKHLSDTIIIVDEPSRVFQVSQYFDSVHYEMNKGEFVTHIGKYQDEMITVISSGMGSDNTETLMTELDILANIDLKTNKIKTKKRQLKFIKVGTTTAIQEDIAIGSYIISGYAVGFDNLINFYQHTREKFFMDISERVRTHCELDFMPYTVSGSSSLINQFNTIFQMGNTISCPGYYAPQGRAVRLPLRYPRLIEQLTYFHHDNIWFTNLDLETALFYSLGKLLNHEVISISAVTSNLIKNRYSRDENKIFSTLIKKILGHL